MSERAHDTAAQSDARADPAEAGRVPTRGGRDAARMLELQRTAGNRAVGALLARERAQQRSPRSVQRRATQVRSVRQERRTGNRAFQVAGAYEVEFDSFNCNLTIKAHI